MKEEELTKDVRIFSNKLIKLGMYYLKNREDFHIKDLMEETKGLIEYEERKLFR